VRTTSEATPARGAGGFAGLLAQAQLATPGFSIRGGTDEMLLTIVSRQPPAPERDEIGRMADEVLSADLADAWDTITGLGWTSVGVAESDGGSGGTFADLAALVRATGRHACAVPLAEAALARSLCAAPAFAAVAQDFAVADGRVSATADVPETELPGRVLLLSDSRAACVATENISEERWRDLAGRPHLRVECREAPAEVLAVPPGFDPVARLTVLRLHAALGAVEGACRLTREHVTTREQFGRPLSRFQAVAHRLAEMDCARALFEVAVSAAVDLEPARVAAAATLADPVLTTVARLAHQLHGAMGITRESPLHRYTTLLWALRDEIGPARQWALRLHDLAGGDEETLWALVTTRPRGR
jgi:alkylation response protein AidB-like acyl-CoA dehydrogenase